MGCILAVMPRWDTIPSVFEQPYARHVLSVIRNDSEVFVHADLAGLDMLLDRLKSIREKVARGECEHDHLMTEAWADGALTDTLGAEKDGTELVHHLKICGWTEDWAVKHGFKGKSGA